MAYEPTVDSLDAVPEDARPFYRKAADGKFNLITADSIDKLERSLGNTKAEREAARLEAAEAKKWKESGLTLEEIAELKKEKADRETADAEKKGEWDRLKQQMADNHKTETEKLSGKIGQYRTALEKKLIDADAVAAIAGAKGEPTLLLPHIRGRVKVEEKDDDFVVTVLTKDGKGVQLNDKNEPMTIAELVAEMREDPVFGRAFDGSGHSGGDGKGSDGKQLPAGGLKKSEMSTKQKADYMAQHGHAAYRALPA